MVSVDGMVRPAHKTARSRLTTNVILLMSSTPVGVTAPTVHVEVERSTEQETGPVHPTMVKVPAPDTV
jgi:hypothetical protein